MACLTCGRPQTWHGSHEPEGRPGTYLSETGCHDGVRMDDDEYHEGWDPQTSYPPCQFNPNRCPTCDGTGRAPPMMVEALERDDCADCGGSGWKNGDSQWPVAASDLEQDEPLVDAAFYCPRCGTPISKDPTIEAAERKAGLCTLCANTGETL